MQLSKRTRDLIQLHHISVPTGISAYPYTNVTSCAPQTLKLVSVEQRTLPSGQPTAFDHKSCGRGGEHLYRHATAEIGDRWRDATDK